MSRKRILVLGTGRSGTCWMGELLGQHPQIRSFVEPRPLFDLVTRAALDDSFARRSLRCIFDEYERLFEIAAPLHVADKSHPAIWIAEALAAQFGNAWFIGMTRGAVSTVASMLRHSGVRRWCEDWEEYPVPNRFLGITRENFDWYRRASLTQRCVARWWSHRAELFRLQKTLPGRLINVRYEDLVSSPVDTMAQVQRFLTLDASFPAATPHRASLDKWKDQLSPNEVAEVERAVCLMDTLADHPAENPVTAAALTPMGQEESSRPFRHW